MRPVCCQTTSQDWRWLRDAPPVAILSGDGAGQGGGKGLDRFCGSWQYANQSLICMQKTTPAMAGSVGMLGAFCGSVGLGLLLAFVWAMAAGQSGWLFGGLDTYIAVVGATVFCAVVTLVVVLIMGRCGKRFSWRRLVWEVACVSLLGISLLSWYQTREALRMFFNPLPVPEELRVYRGKSELFGSVVHFSSSPAVIVAMIHSKELVEVPDTLDKPENSTSVSGYGVLRDTRTPWDWWQPAMMAHPRFFFCDHHTGPGGQGWCEGWWINEATNEVYALIRD